MKKLMMNYGGILFFYLAIIACILLINMRFNYLSNNNAFNDVNIFNK